MILLCLLIQSRFLQSIYIVIPILTTSSNQVRRKRVKKIVLLYIFYNINIVLFIITIINVTIKYNFLLFTPTRIYLFEFQLNQLHFIFRIIIHSNVIVYIQQLISNYYMILLFPSCIISILKYVVKRDLFVYVL